MLTDIIFLCRHYLAQLQKLCNRTPQCIRMLLGKEIIGILLAQKVVKSSCIVVIAKSDFL